MTGQIDAYSQFFSTVSKSLNFQGKKVLKNIQKVSKTQGFLVLSFYISKILVDQNKTALVLDCPNNFGLSK